MASDTEDNKNTSEEPSAGTRFLPDLCSAESVFIVVVAGEVLAIILSLATPGAGRDFWTDFALRSLFIQWVALSSAGVICLARTRLHWTSATLVGVAAFTLIVLVTALYSVLAMVFFSFARPLSPLEYVARNMAVSGLIAAATLRYLYVNHQWREQVKAEAQARLEALHARIRPHFLFNSLNTVVTLLREQPGRAESVLLNMADLFRAALAERERMPLADELALARRYLEIEQLRLDERLTVDWQQPEPLPKGMQVPSLVLQPLIENAIYHGIQPLPEGGTLRVRINATRDSAEVEITNPLPRQRERHPGGHRMALNNVHQRLKLAFGETLNWSAGPEGDIYRVWFTIREVPQT